MSDVVFVRGDGTAPAEPPKQPRRRKPSWEVMDPGERASWRDLPRLLTDSLRLVWEAGRKEFLITTASPSIRAAPNFRDAVGEAAS